MRQNKWRMMDSCDMQIYMSLSWNVNTRVSPHVDISTSGRIYFNISHSPSCVICISVFVIPSTKLDQFRQNLVYIVPSKFVIHKLFTPDSTYQILSESVGFCRRYDEKIVMCNITHHIDLQLTYCGCVLLLCSPFCIVLQIKCLISRNRCHWFAASRVNCWF